MADLVKLRRDTAANWTSNNPVLNDGEMGFDSTNKKIKVGDGATTWASLTYMGAANTTTTIFFEGSSDVVITTGEKQPLIICPVDGTIVRWRMTSYPAATISCSVWKLNGSRPTIANKITASAPPSLTASDVGSSTTLTGWTTTVAAGDCFVLNVDSNNAATTVYLALEIQ